MASEIVNMIVQGLIYAYNWLVDVIKNLLMTTIFKERPDLASQFSSALTLLISLTALYILITFISAIRKIIGILLIIGWIALIIAFVLASI
jgi:hypothetical protein